MSRTIQLTKEQAMSEVSYDPLTGLFSRVSKGRGKKLHGKTIGTMNKQGYLVARINFTQHKLHRIAWLMSYGEYPDSQIDHINRIKTDNRLSNLRLVSAKQNSENRGIAGHGISGMRGVSWNSRLGKWRASIGSSGIRYELGHFAEKEDARVAYFSAAEKLHTHNFELEGVNHA